jgi:hypothetical protein
MAKAWLAEEWRDFLPRIAQLGTAQEEEIARLCEAQITAWRARPQMKKPSSLRVPMTATRNKIKEIPLTEANRWKNPRTGKFEHIALKYMNFSEEEWAAMNALADEKFQQRLEQQQLIDHPLEVVARAEKLLASDRSDDLAVGLAVVTGRRLTELLKTGRFFPRSLYTVTFDGQLKRRDIILDPYEIPTLVPAELVLSAWRKLRSLEDCVNLDIDEVSARYSRVMSENARRHFTGLIPQRSTREDLYTHAFRAVYARLAVLFFCPVQTSELLYVNAILGQRAHNEQQRRDFAATVHYFDYRIGDGHGQIDGRQGIRLDEPGVEIVEAFRPPRKEGNMTEIQEQAEVLTTKPRKNRGLLTVKQSTGDIVFKLMDERNMRRHDEIVSDLVAHDATAHQMYALLQPLAAELDQEEENPVAILQALIGAYRAGGFSPQPGMAELMREVSDEKDPVDYLRSLVERDRNFKKAIANRHAGTDYQSLAMKELERIKTPEAASERFRRAVDAIMAHNDAQTDPLHLWYINAAAVRDLVGGRNDAVQAYLETRRQEIDEHHKQYNLTPRQNRKPTRIEDEIVVE